MQRRRFRDVFFLLLYAAFWAGMVYIAVIAYKQGTHKPAKFAEVLRSLKSAAGVWADHGVLKASIAYKNITEDLMHRSSSKVKLWHRLGREHLRTEELLEWWPGTRSDRVQKAVLSQSLRTAGHGHSPGSQISVFERLSGSREHMRPHKFTMQE